MKPKTKSDETRARILEAAVALFRRRGFDAATMREIAAEAGVATGAAYYSIRRTRSYSPSTIGPSGRWRRAWKKRWPGRATSRAGSAR